MNRRNKRWAGILALTALASILVWILVGRRPSLLDRATRTIRPVAGGSYLWLSDQEVALFPIDTNQKMEAVRVDLKTGAQTPLDGFNGALREIAAGETSGWSLAPNGKRVAFTRATPELPSLRIISDLKGVEPYEWPTDSLPSRYGDFAWLPDSRRWLEIGAQQSLWLHSLDTPERAVPIPMPAVVTALLGVTTDYCLITHDTPVSQSKARLASVDIHEIGLYPHAPSQRKFTLRIPHSAGGCDIREIALSPRGDRLALTSLSSHRPLLAELFGRLLPALAKNAVPIPTVHLWTARLDGKEDGKEPSEIGSQELSANRVATPEPANLRWTPDGKRLSFTVNKTLYTVPADPD